MIRIDRLTKRFQTGRDDVLAMDNLSVNVTPGEFFTLLGPSGCGKSTLLRCLAGLETPESGEIRIGDHVAFSSQSGVNVPPNRRRVGMVFQSYAIWPHMTVFQNVAFPLEVQKQSDIHARTMAALDNVGLAALADRYASRLSGGQQQRVAFARAVVSEPDLLLLDEPLSNLDAALREQMRFDLRKLHDRLGITTVYVTHDQAEALSMSDRIAVMRTGRFVEIATPETLYDHPKAVFTARFLGGANVLAGDARSASGGGVEIVFPFGTLVSSRGESQGPVTAFIRPERVNVSVERPESGVNVLSCQIVGDRFVGDSRELELDLGETVVRCKTSSRFSTGADGVAFMHIDPDDLYILEGQDEAEASGG